MPSHSHNSGSIRGTSGWGAQTRSSQSNSSRGNVGDALIQEGSKLFDHWAPLWGDRSRESRDAEDEQPLLPIFTGEQGGQQPSTAFPEMITDLALTKKAPLLAGALRQCHRLRSHPAAALLAFLSSPVTLLRHCSGYVSSKRVWGRPSSLQTPCLLGSALLLFLLLVWAWLWTIFRPPEYVMLPSSTYFRTLEAFAKTQLFADKDLTGRDRWKADLLTQLQDGEQRRQSLLAILTTPGQGNSSTLASDAKSLVPATIFSSDRVPAPAGWSEQWTSLGFHPVQFLNDSAANTWMSDQFAAPTGSTGLSKTLQAWHALPRGVMRADFLRYLLLLVEGGTWSDMDAEPLAAKETWAEGALISKSTSWATKDQNIRLVVGVECDPVSYKRVSFRGLPEFIRILPMNRHREVQFVQWTLHSAAGHPVMADVLRRMLDSHDIFTAYKLDLLRDAYADTMRRTPSHPSEATAETQGVTADPKAVGSITDAAQKLVLNQRARHPWTSARMVWRWMRGAWRLTWHPLSVEEWTGPAVFTDSVISYLNAIAGTRVDDLLDLKQPIQIGDVIVLPYDYFNPGATKKPRAKVIHHYRGSWKHGADVPT
ncbi:glycosyltransferase family 32 protein [Tilletiaria anomala UBC 951]|uniref:Glycosyltransferase family 32 protein n=1 Tax=Tilletiaria anomala (strain ATCC 24038 / CBS 436.72 / UBC 951) TaxID=1037660 RepID=A0A066VPZ9_TILAU|nr:glycosyltransferase family 32 protein [Tilletiaria anomala UBC 951]KDN43566.1 glycosyltransferase family 32 protein [Tilletiaria anomala UBC 951]